MRKTSLIVRLLIIILLIIILIGLVMDAFKKSHNQILHAKLDGQKVILSIEEELKKSELRKIEQDYILTENLIQRRENNYIEKEIETVKLAKNYQDKNIVTIIITGVGLSKLATDKVFELPNNVTLGFSPYAANLDEQLKRAVELGYESLINIPMQNRDYPQTDPGRLGLIKDLSDTENFQRFQTILGNNQDYVGIYTERDEIFTNLADKMQAFLKYIYNHKLLYVYGGESENEAFRQLAKQNKVKLIEVNNSVINGASFAEVTQNQLELLEKYAEKQGYAVGFITPYPHSLDLLNQWITSLEQKNIYLVPITILNKKIENIK